MSSIVHVVDCIDTEGPLSEPLEATFDRIKEIWGIGIKPSQENLQKLRNKKIDLKGNEKAVAELVAPNLLKYNNNWEKLNSMLKKITSPEYRNKIKDSFGNGWIYSWFCVDHVGYKTNLRNREFGYHKIFDHYTKLTNLKSNKFDGVHFHYHPMPFNRNAHHCATSYFGHSDTLYKSSIYQIKMN